MPGTMEVESYRKIGELLIKLATDQESVPESLNEKIDLLQRHGVVVSGYDDIEFVRKTPNVLRIPIPERGLLQEALDEIADQASAEQSYPFPPGVAQAYRDALDFADVTAGMTDAQKVEKKREILQFRIGDYSLGNCK